MGYRLEKCKKCGTKHVYEDEKGYEGENIFEAAYTMKATESDDCVICQGMNEQELNGRS